MPMFSMFQMIPVCGIAVVLGAAFVSGTEVSGPRQPLLIVHDEEGRKGEIMAVDPGDGLMTNLTNNPRHTDNFPSWSPDGERIAFNSHRTGGWAVWVMNADGSDPERVLRTGTRTLNPSWSPDGTMLTFFGDPNGYWNIGIAASDGSGVRWLTNDQNINRNPSFSADGKEVLFYSTRATGQELDLFTVALEGGEVRNLTRTPDMNEFAPAYSPDGSRIAFYELEVNSNTPVGSIVVMDADGSDRRVVAPVSGGPGKDYRDVRLTWAEDGSVIYFIGYNGTRDGTLFRVPADGSAEFSSVVGMAGRITDPHWCNACDRDEPRHEPRTEPVPE